MGYGTDNYSRLTTQKQHNLSVEDVSFSEVVYGDLPQFPRIHVEFGSLNRLPGTKIVSLLKQILDGMLEMFRNRYSGIMNVPNSPNDVVVMDEYGQNRYGYWTTDFHIQATSFTFANYKEAKEFTLHVRSSSTCPKESLHKKISRFSQFLGTNVNIHKNELFVKKFLVLDRIVHPSSSIADSNTKNSCVPCTQSVRSISPNVHGTTDIIGHHDAISYRENDLAIQQRASSFVEQELPDENFYGDKQTDIIHSGEATITVLSAKKSLPPICNEYAVAMSYVTEEKNDILKGQRHQRQHNGSAKTGKKLGQRNSNCWKRWKFHNNPYIRSRNGLRKNDVTNWVRMLVSATALVRSVICMQSTSRLCLVFTESRIYEPVPHIVLAITSSCQSYHYEQRCQQMRRVSPGYAGYELLPEMIKVAK
ncbi:unnamed protein product [Rhizophagus irregularis]|uniref:Uncharacterized protein n=1 Tax=Rhizophagus irregularis TaxID=588596 RepID=A0A915ZRS4_9GLOM|nr:unnamed protein product [Rhizophagus irregularis]